MDVLKSRISSDKGASNTVETVLLIAMAVFAVIVVTKYIMEPIRKSSENIGDKIEEMGN